MEYHLIAFFGASPGAGKSTLSAFLSQQFHLHRLPHRWIYEEDPLPEFQPFFQALQAHQPDTIAQYLRATAAFASTCATTHLTIIDSILPGYSFFFGTQPLATIADMSQHLHTILAPLRPVLVY